MTTTIFQIQRTQFARIDFDDKRYSFLPFDEDIVPESLSRQIKRSRVLQPPILQRMDTGVYTAVAGRKRLLAAKNDLAMSACDCFIVPSQLPEAETLVVAFEEALLHGKISPVEKAFFLKKMCNFVSITEAAERFLPLLGASPHPFLVKQCLSITDLDQEILKALHNGNLDEKAAIELASLSFRDRHGLYELIKNLKMSVGNQRKTIAICKELSARGKTSILQILLAEEIQEILEHRESNTPQKTANLMRCLQKKLMPRLTGAEKNFSQFCQQISLPNWATLTHSAAFEKDELILTLTFSDKTALISFIEGAPLLRK